MEISPDTTGLTEADITKAKMSGEIQINEAKASRQRAMIEILTPHVGVKQLPGQQSVEDRIRGHLKELEKYQQLVDVGRGYRAGP